MADAAVRTWIRLSWFLIARKCTSAAILSIHSIFPKCCCIWSEEQKGSSFPGCGGCPRSLALTEPDAGSDGSGKDDGHA